MNRSELPTRKDFLLTVAGAAMLPPALAAAGKPAGSVLIVVAHPDDEYTFAASTYRLVRECGWAADQVILTNGESGYRYSTLASVYYGVELSDSPAGRANLAAIRKEEARRAGKILGIRDHQFLEQKDLGFGSNAAAAESGNWDRAHLRSLLTNHLRRTRYDAVFTLLPTSETHGHHRAATLLTLEAVASLPEEERPLVFGVEARAKSDPPLSFAGLSDVPLTRTVDSTPVLAFDRGAAFGYRSALNYQIVVDWVIAEHKSQGLFQTDAGKHQLEQFWLFEASGKDALRRLAPLRQLFHAAITAA